ncbi:hypothetical protein [uncultured Psychroserpens sp.]|uniref:hypothetical protein n=1 Tax=uncultured Psychroserpens sp. TaxID=255436 RepID=UPI002628C639|nr:hypothetical protein [uncultured Psychroserpens sp.]
MKLGYSSSLEFLSVAFIPKNAPKITAIVVKPSIGNPGGGGGIGGGGSPPCAAHTKLINTNKIEAMIFLFCILITA